MTSLSTGSCAELDVYDAGPARPYPPVGSVNVIILRSGRHESDVMLVPNEDNVENARALFEQLGLDLEDLKDGPVYVLSNQNNEWLRRIAEWFV